MEKRLSDGCPYRNFNAWTEYSMSLISPMSGLVLLYKLAPVHGMAQRTVLAVAVAALGVLYVWGG